MKINGLILSAGLSGRMNSFKPILQLNNKPLVVLISEKLLKVCDEIFIVTGFKREMIEETVSAFLATELERIKFVHNNNFHEGMFSSLKKGIAEAQNSDWLIYHFVDQPTLPDIFYEEFTKQISSDCSWIQPAYNSVKGHPILLNSSIYDLILDAEEKNSLREVSYNENIKKKIWDCNYHQILHDINKKDDFDKLNK